MAWKTVRLSEVGTRTCSWPVDMSTKSMLVLWSFFFMLRELEDASFLTNCCRDGIVTVEGGVLADTLPEKRLAITFFCLGTSLQSLLATSLQTWLGTYLHTSSDS